jgi:hypothetical protein
MNGSPATVTSDFGSVSLIGRKRAATPPASIATGITAGLPHCATILVPSNSKRKRTSASPAERMAWRTRAFSSA